MPTTINRGATRPIPNPKNTPPKNEPAERDLAKDADISAGLKALGTTIGEPAAKGKLPVVPATFAPGGPSHSLFYNLWSVERVAVTYSLDTIGNKDWYA